MPISKKGREKVISLIPEDFEGRIVDLGSGFGTFIFPAAKRFPKAAIVGAETARVPYFCSVIWKWILRADNVKIQYKDLTSVDLLSSDIVFCYLYPKGMEKVSSAIAGNNITLISYAFALSDRQPISTFSIGSVYPTNIFVYRILEKSKSSENKEKTF